MSREEASVGDSFAMSGGEVDSPSREEVDPPSREEKEGESTSGNDLARDYWRRSELLGMSWYLHFVTYPSFLLQEWEVRFVWCCFRPSRYIQCQKRYTQSQKQHRPGRKLHLGWCFILLFEAVYVATCLAAYVSANSHWSDYANSVVMWAAFFPHYHASMKCNLVVKSIDDLLKKCVRPSLSSPRGDLPFRSVTRGDGSLLEEIRISVHRRALAFTVVCVSLAIGMASVFVVLVSQGVFNEKKR